jgi:drug/metabolite transporter (DMT)-like permease
MIYIFIAMLFYSVAIVLGAVASRHLNSNLSAGLMNLISAVVPMVVAAPFLSKKTLETQKFGLIMALLAGVCITVFAMALTKSYALNKVGIIAPIVFGGALFLSTLLSYLFLKEKVTALQVIGFVFLLIGLGFVSYARATGK